MICQACGAKWYSAAAVRMAATDEPCPACRRGPLVASDEPIVGDDDEEDQAGREAPEWAMKDSNLQPWD